MKLAPFLWLILERLQLLLEILTRNGKVFSLTNGCVGRSGGLKYFLSRGFATGIPGKLIVYYCWLWKFCLTRTKHTPSISSANFSEPIQPSASAVPWPLSSR
ncbi:hypothetical protein TSAR_002110 [Trichomalopsis sarcophagae]|uniref:Uncharacterized protein n=1 Tax=Trichomalopsis sarcophagae TaxID=543379 RepID=A0A232EYG3_9HYME|nr:hypothetical protein TSAR_002110 [Trichomalopsis sarcophagae]